MRASNSLRRRVLQALLFSVVLVGYSGLVGCEHKTVVEERGHGHHDDWHHDDHRY